MAVLSDVAHLATEVLAYYVVAIVASHVASAPASTLSSLGLKQVESLVTLFLMITLAVMLIASGMEAVQRIFIQIHSLDKEDINSVDGKEIKGLTYKKFQTVP